MNTYAYVGGNPVSGVDPDGLNAITFGGRLAWAGGTLAGRAVAPHIARAMVAAGMVSGLKMDSNGNIVPEAANDNEPAPICKPAAPPPADPVKCFRREPKEGIPTSSGARLCRYSCPDGSIRESLETFSSMANVCSPTKIFFGNLGL